jgi:hypothetical protein
VLRDSVICGRCVADKQNVLRAGIVPTIQQYLNAASFSTGPETSTSPRQPPMKRVDPQLKSEKWCDESVWHGDKRCSTGLPSAAKALRSIDSRGAPAGKPKTFASRFVAIIAFSLSCARTTVTPNAER